LTDKSALEANPHLNITIVADKEAKTLTITDGGVGMTRKELKENLGTIAKSGTSEFMTALENKTADIGLIGQFGVGFYSVFLIADSVSVVSKNNKDEQYIWTSTASKDFTIAKDPRGSTLGRGTQIVMHLKEDSLEYLEQDRLKSIIQKYSEFMNFPIYLWSKKTYTEEVPVEEEKKEEEKKDEEKKEEKESDVEDVTEEKKEAEKPKTKTVTKTKEEWEQMNTNKPLWTRDPKEVKEQEYADFFKAFTKEQAEPLAWTHFRAEGETEFKSLLFIPESPPQKLFNGEEDHKNIKVFVKRVLVTDHIVDFLPRWLNFLKGLIDCDDIPINVSRETLQQHSVFNVMKNKIIGKTIALFEKLANDSSKSEKFFKNYGASLKIGVIEDQKSQKKLLPLLRFPSSASSNVTGFDDYISRMKKNQSQIFYLTGTSVEDIKASPFVERVIGRGYEVLVSIFIH
jgi:heat shock protein beta